MVAEAAKKNREQTPNFFVIDKEIRDKMLIELKKHDLQKKFDVKNKLNDIFDGAIDDRKSNWDQYFSNLAKIYNKELTSD